MKKPVAGQVIVEYAIVCALVLVLLFQGEPAPLDQLLDAFKSCMTRFSMLMGAP